MRECNDGWQTLTVGPTNRRQHWDTHRKRLPLIQSLCVRFGEWICKVTLSYQELFFLIAAPHHTHTTKWKIENFPTLICGMSAGRNGKHHIRQYERYVGKWWMFSTYLSDIWYNSFGCVYWMRWHYSSNVRIFCWVNEQIWMNNYIFCGTREKLYVFQPRCD